MKSIFTFLAFSCFQTLLFGQVDTNTTQKNIQVNEVIVRGQKGNGLINNTKKPIDGQTSTDKVLGDIDGVTMIKRGNYALEPTIRGLNAGQINTTIDGMQIFGACTDKMDPISSYVEPNNLKSINVGFGPNEEQYGSSIGGGFNFKLMKAQLNASNKFSGSAGVGYETNANALQTLGSLQYSQKRWAIQVNSIYRKADNYTAANREEILYSQYEKWNIGINTVFALNENNRIYLDYLQDNGTDIGYPALTMDVSFANAKIGSVAHELKRSGKKFYQLTTKFYYNFIDHAMDDTKRPDSLVTMHMDMPGTSQTYGFYSNARFHFGEKHYVRVKVNSYVNDLHAEMTMYPDIGAEMFMLTIPDARRIVNGIDISDKIIFSNKFKINTGIRLDYAYSTITTDVGRQTISSIYTEDPDKGQLISTFFGQATYSLTKKLTLHGGISHAMRAPTLQELYGFYLFNRLDNYDYLGNPDLKQEQSWNSNLALQYATERFIVKGQVFSYNFKNYISGIKMDDYSNMTIGASGVKQYTNLEKATLYGTEFSIKWKVAENLYFSSNNSVTVGLDDENKSLPLIPPFKSINSITYTFKGIRMNVEYVSSAAQNNIDYDKYGETRTDSFHLFNAYVSKSIKGKKLQYDISFAVENIFDTAYTEHLDFQKINRQGINFITHLTIKF